MAGTVSFHALGRAWSVVRAYSVELGLANILTALADVGHGCCGCRLPVWPSVVGGRDYRALGWRSMCCCEGYCGVCAGFSCHVHVTYYVR